KQHSHSSAAHQGGAAARRSVPTGEAMKHWKVTLSLSALLLAALAGCSQPCCVRDYDDFFKRAGVPGDLACNPDIENHPTLTDTGVPTTINYPERDPWYITLHEAIARSLESGVTGTQSVRGFGSVD